MKSQPSSVGAASIGCAISLACLLTSGPIAADAVLDGSTGSSGSFAGDFEIPAAVGRRAGGNLFHSFERFGIARGERATFTGPRGIDNVIGRVTGDDISRINGRLVSEVAGADFFFLNPNGVVFGPQARLDLDGSFHVSTADELRFADGTVLGMDGSSPAGFTVAAPEAFGFLGAGAGAITIDRGQLRADPGRTISLVAGPITLDGGGLDEVEVLHTDGGRIRLAAVGGAGRVDLRAGDADFETGSTIRVVDGASVNTDRAGGGEVRIVGERLVVRGASIGANNSDATDSTGGVFVRAERVLVDGDGVSRGIGANASGDGDAGRVEIEADAVEVRDRGAIASNARSGGTGDGGRVEVRAGRLVVDDLATLESTAFEDSAGSAGRVIVRVGGAVRITDGGSITTRSFGPGDAGDVTVRAGRLLIARSGSDITAEAAESSTGAAGDVSVTADDVAIRGNAFISTGTRARGDAGRILVEAGTLRMSGAMTGIGSQPGEASTGAGGTVMVLAGEVRLRDGAGISTRTFGDGDAGAVTVEADRLLVTNGSDISSDAGTGSTGSAGTVTVSADRIELRDRASISSEAGGEGDAGTILVAARRLRLDNGRISTQAFRGSSEAGEIVVRAERIELHDRGRITSDTFAGDAGPVTVVSDTLRIGGGLISSETRGAGDGGPIIVRADRLDIDDRGEISSDTLDRGDAGIVLVDADRVRVRSGSISSDSLSSGPGGGDAGNVLVNARTLFVGPRGSITSQTSGGGRAGQVVVVADDADVLGEVGTTSMATGDAGTIALAGERLSIRDAGLVTSRGSGSGAAGDILLRTGALTLDGASITTEGQRGGRIRTDERTIGLIHLADSQITSNGIEPSEGDSIIELGARQIVLNSSAVTSLTGGRVIVGSGEASLDGDLTVISSDSTVAASSRLEIAGLESDITAGIEVLPSAFFDVSDQLRESCAARVSETRGTFARASRGGVAPGPDRLLAGSYARSSGSPPVDASVTGTALLALPAGCRG